MNNNFQSNLQSDYERARRFRKIKKERQPSFSALEKNFENQQRTQEIDNENHFHIHNHHDLEQQQIDELEEIQEQLEATSQDMPDAVQTPTQQAVEENIDSAAFETSTNIPPLVDLQLTPEFSTQADNEGRICTPIPQPFRATDFTPEMTHMNQIGSLGGSFSGRTPKLQSNLQVKQSSKSNLVHNQHPTNQVYLTSKQHQTTESHNHLEDLIEDTFEQTNPNCTGRREVSKRESSLTMFTDEIAQARQRGEKVGADIPKRCVTKPEYTNSLTKAATSSNKRLSDFTKQPQNLASPESRFMVGMSHESTSLGDASNHLHPTNQTHFALKLGGSSDVGTAYKYQDMIKDHNEAPIFDYRQDQRLSWGGNSAFYVQEQHFSGDFSAKKYSHAQTQTALSQNSPHKDLIAPKEGRELTFQTVISDFFIGCEDQTQDSDSSNINKNDSSIITRRQHNKNFNQISETLISNTYNTYTTTTSAEEATCAPEQTNFQSRL